MEDLASTRRMQIARRQRASDRPARRDLDPTALALLERHGAQILATARRYAANPEDAEDAYQRAFEILLTKARLARRSSSRG